uniref:C2 domain-containing protein n=1 Tax=Parascaris univalens TaxID=6257 RepID=A0A915AEB8_PARUN
MWTKTEKGLDPLFVAPSTVRNRAEISGYFKYQQVATPLSGMPSPSSNSSVLWKANSARRKRFEPFCSPIAPHVPIRQRLSNRRCTSVDASNECDEFTLPASNPYLYGRRRRMSLLQTLRYQNKQLADSGFESQTNEKIEQDMSSPSGTLPKRCSDSPPSSPIEEEKMQKTSRSSLSKLRAKTKAFFGKKGEKELRIMEEGIISNNGSSRCCPSESERGIYSCIDFTAKARERNERRETMAVIERPPLKAHMNELSKISQLRRTISCPQLGLNLRIYHEISRRAISMRNRKHSSDTESGEDEDDFHCSSRDVERQISETERSTHPCPQSPRSEKSEEAVGIIEREDIKFAERMLRNSSPLSAADFLLEKRLQMRAVVMTCQQEANTKPLTKGSTNRGIPVSSANGQSVCNFRAPPEERNTYSMNEVNGTDDMNKDDEVAKKLETVALREVDSRSMSTHASEEFEEDDNISTTLDHYLPFLSEIYSRRAVRSQRSSSQSSAVNNRSEEDDESNVGQGTRKVLSVTETQTDLSLIHISERLSAYLAELGVTVADDDVANDKEVCYLWLCVLKFADSTRNE